MSPQIIVTINHRLTRRLRGLAGTILVYKVAAALSDKGADLDSVENIAKYVASRLGTLGVGLEHCHVKCISRTTKTKAHLS